MGKKAQLEARNSYGEVKIKKYLVCPGCGEVSCDLGRYFDKEGEFIAESYWFDTVLMVKTNIKENRFECSKCLRSYSFRDGEIVVSEERSVIKKAGSSAERGLRFREKRKIS